MCVQRDAIPPPTSAKKDHDHGRQIDQLAKRAAKKNAGRDAERAAAQAYAAKRSDIARLIDVLEMELARHDERAKADATDWGFASNWGIIGNLGKVRSDLIDTVGFISNMERAG